MRKRDSRRSNRDSNAVSCKEPHNQPPGGKSIKQNGTEGGGQPPRKGKKHEEFLEAQPHSGLFLVVEGPGAFFYCQNGAIFNA